MNGENDGKEVKAEKESKGIRCADCGCTDCRVTHTERLRTGHVRRRRECRHCGRRFVTWEVGNGEGFWKRHR